jgi:hypothetical protein
MFLFKRSKTTNQPIFGYGQHLFAFYKGPNAAYASPTIFCVMQKHFLDSKKIVSASEKCFREALNVFSTRKNIFLILQNNVSKAGKIFSAFEKIVPVLENIFWLPKNIF